MIKVERHPLTCDCADCESLFPADRFDASWPAPRPERDDIRPATAGIPIGGARPALRFSVWLDPEGRLACDWPGLPGTIGARVAVREPPPGSDVPAHIVGTDDALLAGFVDGAPLRRRLTGRMNARLMVEFGLAPPEAADFVPCSDHGLGVSASTCRHLQEATERRDVAVLYGVDGDFPDVLCVACVERLAAGDLQSLRTTCSRCVATLARHHRIVSTGWYGQ